MCEWRRAGRLAALTAVSVAFLAGCATGVPEAEVADVYFKLGNAYFELRQFDNAVSAYTQALSFDESLARASYNLAQVYLESGRIEEARDILDDLLEDDPDNSIVLSTLGWAYYLEGELERALEVYRRVHERLPGDVDALYNKAALLRRLDRHEEALEAFLELQELEPSTEYLSAIADLYELLDRPAEAVKYLERYVTESDKAVEERVSLADLYADVRDYGKSVAMYEEALDRMEQPDPQVLFRKGRVLLAFIEDFEEGLASIRGAFQAGFSDAEAVTELAALVPGEVKAQYEALVEEFGLEAQTPDAGEAGDGVEPVEPGALQP